MLTYEKCCELLKGKRSESVKIAHNTYLHRLGADEVGIKYHNTYIIKITSRNLYTLDNGGWFTSTTKARLSKYSPARVSQKKGIWFISGFPYENKIVIDFVGNIIRRPSTPAPVGDS